MSRVSIKTRNDLPAELQPLWDKMTTYGAFENQAGVMAHRPPIFRHTWSLLVDLAESGTLSKRHLEIALVAVSLCGLPDAGAQRPPTIAAAANLNFALTEIAKQFARDRGTRVEVVFGASGTLTRQIRDGAPFERLRQVLDET